MDEPLRSTTLSLQAAFLLRILRDYTRGKNYCWPGQARLAVLMGRTTRSVRVYLQELRQAGLVVVSRQGLSRTNRYYVAAASAEERKPTSDQERKPTSDQERKPTSDQERKPTCVSNLNYLGENSSSSGNGAAAVLSAPQEMRLAEEQLVELGLSPGLARRWAGQSADLCLAIVPHCRERFAQRLQPVDNPPGYMVRLWQDPVGCGFTQTADGRWHAPAWASPKARFAAEDAAKRQEAQERERSRKEEAGAKEVAEFRSWRAFLDRLEALPAAERQAVVAETRRTWPLHCQGRADDSFSVLQLCRIVLEKREAKP